MSTWSNTYDKLNYLGGTNMGAYITDHFTAKLGWEWKEDNSIQIFAKSHFLENFTATADGVSGTIIEKGGINLGVYDGHTGDQRDTPEPLEHVFTALENPDNGHNMRMAFFLVHVTDSNTQKDGYKLDWIFYDVQTQQFGTPYVQGTRASQYEIWPNIMFVRMLDRSDPSYDYTEEIDISKLNGVIDVSSGDFPSLVQEDIFKVYELSSNIPIFDDETHARAYLQDITITEGLLNGSNITPEEEYKEQFDYWYIRNKVGHNTRNTLGTMRLVINYRFTPKRKGICFVKHTPTPSEPWDRELLYNSGYTNLESVYGDNDDDDYTEVSDVGIKQYLTKSISFGPNNYYTKFEWATNIPTWNTRQDAEDYFNGLKDISEADNYSYISSQDAAIINPDLPGTDVDTQTDVGTNGMRYSYGNRLYEMSNIELATLMGELFDPANVQDILDGTKLFGSNNMEAVSGVIYIPLTDLSQVCDVGSSSNVKVGSWTADNATGKRIISNDKTIDCGSFFYGRIYQDFRDYEPYNLLFANLPFVGMHQLTISKYLDKTVKCEYNIDVCTGAIVCKLYGDGILLDVFEGTCGASRPISATDNNAYINSIVGAITGASASASGSIEGITNAVSSGAGATGLAAGGAVLSGMAVGTGAAAGGIFKGYEIKQAVDNPPQMHSGSLAGNLAYNLNTKPTFLFFTKRTIRPANEISTIGLPSGQGDKIGHFSGYLKCSSVKLNNFPGTKQEYNDLINILSQGIYI